MAVVETVWIAWNDLTGNKEQPSARAVWYKVTDNIT